MKIRMILPALLLVLLAATEPSRAQSPTALTYQGRLTVAGQPANGYFDFRFALYAVNTGGTSVANTIAKPPLWVTNGLFATTLDFGTAGFPGDNRWLEIAVRPTGNRDNYVPLSPRQRITAAPYALQARTVADGAVTAEKLSSGAGQDGQVLKLNAGQLTWSADNGGGGGVSSISSGLGLVGGPITSTGTLAIDTAIVPRLNVANAFPNPGNSFVGTFTGNGAGLTNLSGVASTNYNGANITNLNASNITSGTLNDARLSANVALRSAHQTFTGSNTFTGVAVMTNNNNRFTGTFSGNGTGLTSLGGANIQDGTVNSNKLDVATRALLGGGLNAAQSNTYNGTFVGNGAAVTNLNAANLASGVLNDTRLSANVALRNANQTFSGANIFSGAATLTNSNNNFAGNGASLTGLNGANLQAGTVNSNKLDVATRALLGGGFNAAQSNTYNGTFVGNGAAVTNLNAANLASGALNDSRLSANVALRNANQTFSGANIFSGTATLTNSNNNFAGNGASLTGLNGANLQAGTVNSNKLDVATRALLGGGFNVTQSNTYNGTFVGNGAAVTNLNAANLAAGALNDARLSANVALRNANQTFSGANNFSGMATLTNSNNTLAGSGAGITGLNGANLQAGTVNSNKFDAATRALLGGGGFNVTQSNTYNGTFVGNGAGLTNVSAALTNALAGDVTGLPAATTVGRIRGVDVAATAPTVNQHLRYSGSAWTPGAVVLGTDVTGTLPVANGGLGLSSFAGGDLLFASSSSSLARLAAAATGNALISGGVGSAPSWGKIDLTTHVSGALPVANGGTAGTSAAAARSNLGAAASGANSDISSLTGLTTPLSVTQGGIGLSSLVGGDLLFASSSSSFSRLADVATGNALLSGGVGNAPLWGKVGLSTHVTGTLPLANGGTGAGTAAAARSSLGAAASGPNADITSLNALTVPLSPSQGGCGQTTYTMGDMLYAPSANSLGKRSIGAAGTVLTSRGGVPVWTNANDHNHFGQVWIANSAVDGLYVQNDSTAAAASGVVGIAGANSSLNYGVFGQTSSSQGTGVQGLALAANGFTVGVNGQASSDDGTGVYGVVTASSGPNAGVIGETSSPEGTGVFGQALATTGTPVGVYGYTAAINGYGLYTPNRLYVGNNAFVGGHLTIGTGSRIQADFGSPNAPGVTFFNNTNSGMYSPAINALGFATSGNQRIHVAADGKVGIGRIATANRLEVEGEASKTTASGWLANSDAAIKRDIHDLSGALEKLEQVRPVAFRYSPEYLRQHPGIEDKVYYNVVAQEFAQVFPESVKSSGETIEGKEILQVDTYPAMIYSIAAVRELRAEVQSRDRELAELRRQNQRLEARLNAIEQRLAAPGAK